MWGPRQQSPHIIIHLREILLTGVGVGRNLDNACMHNLLSLQGQKLLKKESDVGMLLTGKQSTETSCM